MTMVGNIVLGNCKSRRILLPGEEEQPHADYLTDSCSVSRFLLSINSPLVGETSLCRGDGSVAPLGAIRQAG